jgi:hypothetical protein
MYHVPKSQSRKGNIRARPEGYRLERGELESFVASGGWRQRLTVLTGKDLSAMQASGTSV